MKIELFIYDEILAGGAAAITTQIRSAADRPIELHINSPGGNVFDGYAIYNALLAHVPGVTVYIDGLAASIASYIAMAGKQIFMAENAMFMLHRPEQLIGGNSDAMRRSADLLDKCEASIVDAYVRRTKLPREKIVEMLDAETWLTPDMAKAMGFIDGITPALKMAARFDLSKFHHPPAAVTNQTGKHPLEGSVLALLKAALADKVTVGENSTTAEIQDALTVLARDHSMLKLEVVVVAKARDRAQNLVRLIEGFAKSHHLDISGIDPDQAPRVAVPSLATSTVADWEAKIAAAKNPFEVADVTKQFEAAVSAGLVRTSASRF
jgi:ATP-dependent protease ClpP protease subunit